MGLARQSAVTFAWLGAAFVAQAATFSLVARLLGPSDRGTLEALGFVPSVLAAVGHLSIAQGVLVRYAAAPGAVAGTALALGAGMGALVLAAGLSALAWAPGTFFPGLPRRWEAVVLLQAPLQVVGLSAVAILQGARAVGRYNAALHAPKLLALAAVGGLLAAGRFGLGNLVTALTLVVAASTALALVWAWRRTEAPRRWDGPTARALVAAALPLHLGVMALFAARRCGVAVLQVEAAPAELGYFSLASTLADLLWYPALAVEAMLVPRLAQLPPEEGRALAERASRVMCALTAAGGAAAWGLAPTIVRLFGGPAFAPAAAAFQALIPGVVLYVFARMLGGVWMREGRFGFPGAATVLTALTSAGLNLLWVPRYGACGAAWGTGLAYAACGLLFAAAYRQTYRRPLREIALPRAADLRVDLARHG